MDDLIGSLAVAALFSKGAAILLGIVLFVLAVGSVGYVIGTNTSEIQALERGFMEHCANDGRRVWTGECE